MTRIGNLVDQALDMSRRARMQRAREMGFDTERVLFHGTRADIDAFDADMSGLGTHVGSLEQAQRRLEHTADVYRTGFRGGNYGQGANVMPLRARFQRPLEMEDVGTWNDSATVAFSLQGKGIDVPDELIDEAQEIRRSFEDPQDWIESAENAEFMGELRQAIQDAGYDSIRYANEVENTFGNVADLTPAARARKNAIGREINAIDEAERARAPALPDVSSLPEDEIDAALNQWLEAGKVKRYTPDEAARREALLAESMEIERTGRGDPYSYIALDDSQLRSVNAAFDPAQRDSSNLLAGVGGAAVGAGILGAGVAPQEAEANLASGVGRFVRRAVGEGFDARFDPRVKEADRISNMTVETLDRGTTDVPTLRLSDLEGRPFVTSMSDRTAAGGMITGINDVPLSRPVDLRGGQDFMFENPGQVWASAKGPAGQILRAGRETGADAPLFLPWRMAPTGGDFASMTGETMLSFASSNMRPGAKRSLNARLRRMIPNWPGLDDPAAVDAFRAAPDSVRKAAKNMMDVEFRDRGGLNIGEARLAVTDPAQISARDAGIQSVGRIDVASDLASSTHPSYPYGVPGEGVGRIDADVGVYELLPDLAAERGVPDPLNPRPTDIRALQMGAKRGVITEDILRNLQARGVNVADLSGPGLVAAAVGAGLLAPQEAEAGFSSAGARELLKRGKDAFMGSPRITRDANAADLRPRAGASAMRAEPEPFLDRYTVRHGESGSTVFDGDRPVASYDAFNTLVVDPEYRREGIASELIAQRRTMFPDQPPATERTRGAQAAQESAWRRIERGAEGFARPDMMAATGAAGALASFLDMRSGKQDTPYKRFIAEGQRAVEQAIGAGENIGNLAASILAEPIAGYAGLVAGPEAVQRARDYFAPQSMSPAAQQQMIGLGNTLESAGQQIMSGLDAAGQAVGVDRLSDYARYAPGYWAERAVPALQQQFGTQAGSVMGAALRTSPEALSMLSLRPTSAIFRATRAAREAL